MKSTNWYELFYWITRADSVKQFFDTTSTLFTWFTAIFFIAVIVSSIGAANSVSERNSRSEEEDKTDPDIRAWRTAKKYFSICFYVFLPLAMITWFGYVAVPTKKEALLIVAGGGTMQFLTTDSSARKIPHEMSTFVVTELKSMAESAKVDIGLKEDKEKILEEAKKMSAAELMQKMKEDTSFAKVIMNK